MGTHAAMGSTDETASAGARRWPRAGRDERILLLAGGIAFAAHAGAVGLIVARLALSVLARAPIGRSAHAAGRRANGRAGTRRAGRGADGGAERRATQCAQRRSDPDTFGSICSGAVARLLLSPRLARARI